MRIVHFGAVGVLLLAFSACSSTSKTGDEKPVARETRPGMQPDGSMLLHSGWSLRPAGKQVELADFPVNVAVHPSGRYAAVLHGGYSTHQVLIVDLATAKVLSRKPVHDAFYGLTFSADGTKLYCSGASDEIVQAFDFTNADLVNNERLKLRDAKVRSVPGGLAVDRANQHLYVANVWGHRVTRVKLPDAGQVKDIPLGTNVHNLASSPVAPSSDFETAAANKRAEASLFETSPGDTFPYACQLDEKKQRLYVTLWAQAAVAVVDLATDQVLALWQTEEHPCEMALTRDGQYLFVANANRNTVSVLETRSGRKVETIWSALYPHSPPGSTPNSLALSPDDKTLFVANADNNAVAVFDVSKPGKSASLGFIPTGWYPTSVRVTPDGKKLLIANGRGTTTMANPHGPQPGKKRARNSTEQYIGSLYKGTLSIIDLPSRSKLKSMLKPLTAAAYACSPLRPQNETVVSAPANNPVPDKLGKPSPIKYCIYIIKENRTYDQMLGDMPEGNGDPNLCLFPERITPNHHKLARDFVLLDNFYVNSEVSADGHEWTMGAYATDFVKKMWPLSYGHNSSGKFPYPSEGNFDIATPAGGYLWDRAKEAGVSYRSYGEFVKNGRTLKDPMTTRVKTLQGHFDEWFRSFDMTYPDQKRADRFISELKRFEAQGDMPRLQVVRLPNDHTHGTSPSVLSPTSLVADNDLALGRVVEAVSHSRFWPQTAIFIIEDDAQNGPDHVDAHRSPAFVVSPFTRRGHVDSTMYTTTSMLRTMELILGLKPMSQFDAAARPMFNCFQTTPDLRPYSASPANVNLDEKNPRTAWGGNLDLNFAREDAIDDLLLNEVIWRAIKGNDVPMPAPVRAAFVFAGPADQDDDD